MREVRLDNIIRLQKNAKETWNESVISFNLSAEVQRDTCPSSLPYRRVANKTSLGSASKPESN